MKLVTVVTEGTLLTIGVHLGKSYLQFKMKELTILTEVTIVKLTKVVRVVSKGTIVREKYETGSELKNNY